MSRLLTQNLNASGVASCIVVLSESAAASAKNVRRLEGHFTQSDLSQDAALSRAMGRPDPEAGGVVLYYENLGIIYGTIDRGGLAALRSEATVASVSAAPQLSLIRPDRIEGAALATSRTWGIDALGVPALWADGINGDGVVVGHLDTGADGKHPALKDAIKSFAEFDSFGRKVVPAPKAHDTDEHGTHTAATIAGREVRSKHVGVAPGATLASAIVIEGGQVVARVLGGMDWAVGEGVRVLSMSLGFRGFWEDFLPLTKVLRRRGVLPVFAVGNEGPGTSRSPGNYPEALSVGAIDEAQAVANFSSSQRFVRRRDPVVPDLVAPGVNVISAKPGGGFQSMDGSSMATPHVAGLAALLFQARPKATVSAVERAIIRSCSLPVGVDPERANHGMPNAPKALAALQTR